MIYIYVLLDPVTCEVRYVGKTNNLNNRYRHEIHSAKHRPNSCHRNSWIKSLLNLGFKPEQILIDKVHKDEWQFWEKHYISLYKSWGFRLTNHSIGGYGTNSVATETKRKISNALKGNTNKKGKKLSEEQKYKCGFGKRGKAQTKEHIILVSKPVIQCNLSGEFIKEWISGKHAAESLKISQGNINSTCNNKRSSAGGFKWQFK